MKTQTLPLSKIPEARMARMTAITRNGYAATKFDGWTNADAPPAIDHPDNMPPGPDGGMVAVAIAIVSGVFMAGLLAGFLIWGR